jgi:hypothetical protein
MFKLNFHTELTLILYTTEGYASQCSAVYNVLALYIINRLSQI